MNRFKPWLLLVLVFVAGIIVGVVGTRLVVRHWIRSVINNPILLREHVERDLAIELKLTPEQRAKVHEILVQSHEKIRDARNEFQPRLLAIFNETEKNIAATLTPEQQVKYEKFLREKRPLWRPLPIRRQP